MRDTNHRARPALGSETHAASGARSQLALALAAALVTAALVTGAMLSTVVPPASAEDAPGSPGIQMSRYVVALVYLGPEWQPAETSAVQELEQAHLANIFRLRAEGDMLVSGPFAEPEEGKPVGLFVFAVETVAEAEALLKTDPAIAAGHFRAELLPWLTPSALGPPPAPPAAASAAGQ